MQMNLRIKTKIVSIYHTIEQNYQITDNSNQAINRWKFKLTSQTKSKLCSVAEICILKQHLEEYQTQSMKQATKKNLYSIIHRR